MTKIPSVTPKSIEEWRKWLEKNHEKEKAVLLIKYKKHTGKPVLSNAAAMDEAICFGWIDTTIKKLDEERYQQKFVKRGPNANWSKNTLSHAERMIKAGKMTPQGMKTYKLGKKKGPYNSEDRYNMPAELKSALDKEKEAKKFYNTLPPSSKKLYHVLINNFKLPETRKRKLEIAIRSLKENKKSPF